MKRSYIRFAGLFCAISYAAVLSQSAANAGTLDQSQASASQSQTNQSQASKPPASQKQASATTTPVMASTTDSASVSAPAAPRRAKPNASIRGPYYVEFRARTAASYGHAFVWYGKTSDRKVEVAGLHPKGEEAAYMLGHLTWVPADTGASYGDLDEQYLTASYKIYLSEPEAKRVFAYINEIRGSAKFWNAETNNCTSFIGRIAGFMGLRTPFHLIWPEQYVKDLKEMNGGRQTALLGPVQ